MDTLTMMALKKKGPGSTTSSIRSGKSGYKVKGPSSSHSTTSAMVRQIIAHIPDKQKPQAERLTKKIKEIKQKQQIAQSSDLFQELIVPYNRAIYFDQADESLIKSLQQTRQKAMNKTTANIVQTSLIPQQKQPIQQTETVQKFQFYINKMILAFRTLRRMYYQNDLYRTISVKQWRDFDRQSAIMLNSAFLASKIFVARHIERLAYKELLGLSTPLPQQLSQQFLTLMMEQTQGKYLGRLQGKIMDAIIALSRIKRYRENLAPVFRAFLELYANGMIFNCNISNFARMFSQLALYQDIDWRDFGLLDLFLQLIETPVKKQKTSFSIIESSCADLLKMYQKYHDIEEYKEMSSLASDQMKMNSRRSSHSSVGSMFRANTRGVSSSKGLLKADQTESIMKSQRIQDLQYGYKSLQSSKFNQQMMEFKVFDLIDPFQIILHASRGICRLMLPCSQVSFINNTGEAKQVIYNQLLQRGLLEKFLNDPVMKQEFSHIKRCLSTTIAMFVLQTTTQRLFQGQHVIFYLVNLGILDIVSEWSKDPDIVVRGNSAWMFTALCVHHLVRPLDLTKKGIIRDMFTLFLKLYNQPAYQREQPLQTDNIAEKILKMYDYDNFLDNIDGILNKPAKIQHLIFATLIFLSIYDDPNIISAVHKQTDQKVDKPVQQNALCGLMQLLQQDADKMRTFIKILIQFTICDDDSFQQNGIWYLKHIIINSQLNQLVQSQRVDILDVFIAGSVCESQVIQQECVNVLTYLAIEKKAYQNNKEDPLLHALMYLTGVQFPVIRGLAYNGLAALALHGAYAANIIIKQAEGEDYYNSVTRHLKKFRQQFVQQNFKSDTVASYAGINLLLNLSRSATPEYQQQVSQRVFLILDTISAQNQLMKKKKENMNEVGCLQTVRALMCSSSLDIKEEWAISFIERVSRDKSFRLYKILINNKFVPWCLNLMLDSDNLENCLNTANLLRFVLYEFYEQMSFQQEETNIRELFQKLLKKFQWKNETLVINERLVESCLLIFVREKNLILAVSQEVVSNVLVVIKSLPERHPDTRLALSKHLASTANLPQIQNLLIKKLQQAVQVILQLLHSDVYQQKFNAVRILVFLTKSPDFNKKAFKINLLETLCQQINQLDQQDLSGLILSIGNLLVFSRGIQKQNKFQWLFITGYFTNILKKCKENDCHSLIQAFLQLMTKLLVQKEFQDKFFHISNQNLVKDSLNVLIRAVKHKCQQRCQDMSSRSYKFYVKCYTVNRLNLKKYAFSTASQLIRLNQCCSKLKKYKIGQAALLWFVKACKSLQNRRSINPLCEGLISQLCIYLQLHYGILKDESLAEEIVQHSKTMCTIIKLDKVADLLQARVGALLLHSSLTAPIQNDPFKLTERINSILFCMTNSNLPQLHNLAIWSLRQLFIKCQSSPPPFDYQQAFLKAKAVRCVVPKLVEPYRPVQQNALLCLGSLFDNKEMRNEFISLQAVPQMMYQGQFAFKKLQKNEATVEDLNILSAFGSALSRLVDQKAEIQEHLIKEYSVIEFCLQTLQLLKLRKQEQSVSAAQWFTLSLKNILKNNGYHKQFLVMYQEIDGLQLLSDLFHQAESPSYQQLQVDNNICLCFSLIAENPQNNFHMNPMFRKFTQFINKICSIYDKTEYLSKTEVDSHFTLLSTLKNLIYRQLQTYPPDITDDERQEFLQTLNSSGGLEPLLLFEYSNVPRIREMAAEVLERLAPANQMVIDIKSNTNTLKIPFTKMTQVKKIQFS